MIVLQWRMPDPPVALQWRGPDDQLAPAFAALPPRPVAAVIGPPGPPFDLGAAVIDGGAFF